MDYARAIYTATEEEEKETVLEQVTEQGTEKRLTFMIGYHKGIYRVSFYKADRNIKRDLQGEH